MPEQFNTQGTPLGQLTEADFGNWRIRDGFGGTAMPDFDPITFGAFQPPTPRGQTMREAIMEGLPARRPRRSETPSATPKEERVIEFVIEKAERHYTISAVDVNEGNKVIDQWTATTEEDADGLVYQMAELFFGEDRPRDTPPMSLRLNNRTRQRGHLTRDDRARFRSESRDEVSEDQFALDIDEDAIVRDEADEIDRLIRQVSANGNVPF